MRRVMDSKSRNACSDFSSLSFRQIRSYYLTQISCLNCFTEESHFQVQRLYYELQYLLSFPFCQKDLKPLKTFSKSTENKTNFPQNHHIPFLICFLVRLIIFLKSHFFPVHQLTSQFSSSLQVFLFSHSPTLSAFASRLTARRIAKNDQWKHPFYFCF